MRGFERRRININRDNIRITVTGKIVATYLLLALFSLIALVFALNSLHRQTTASRHLVDVDMRAASMARELLAGMFDQERLERLFLIFPQDETINLLQEKYKTAEADWTTFIDLVAPENRRSLNARFQVHHDSTIQLLGLFESKKLKSAKSFYEETFFPKHTALYDALKEFREAQQVRTDGALSDLSDDSSRAYEVTMVLLLLGIGLATPVAVSVILGMHHSLRRLTAATHEIASGNYDLNIDAQQHDEFGQLTKAFLDMGRKLRELEARNLDANPLTHLPGNMVIQQRVEDLLLNGTPFAHAFVDLDNFKVYNDRYGYQKGSDVISMVGDLIDNVLREEGNHDDFLGHIGGDDYIFLTTPEKVEYLAKAIIDLFDVRIRDMYNEEDRATGSFIGQDRFGVERRFELMTISIAIICSETSRYASAAAIGHECAKMKEHLKRLPGSNYLVDRRKGPN